MVEDRAKQVMRSALFLGTGIGLIPHVLLAAEAGRGEQETRGELETIVVTAQRREENLQVVPVAVTVLTSKALQDMHFENVRDLDTVAPGVSVREGAGGQQTAQFSMRGVYGQSTFASDPGVALYVNGIYVPATSGDEFDLADIQRIEVLRGPQGTLFGRNAIGGAVNVITKEPTGEFHAHQTFSAGNLSQYKSRTAVDLPAWGIVSASVAYLHDQADGDVKNLGAGTVWHYGPASGGSIGDLVSPTTLGNHKTNAVAAAVKLETDSGIKVVYRFDWTHKDFSPDAVGVITFPQPTGALLYGAYLSEPAAMRTPLSATRPDAVNNWYSTEGVAIARSHTLTISAPLMEGLTVKDLFGYRYNSVMAANQLSGVGGLYTSNLPFGLNRYPPGTPFLPLENDIESQQKTLSNELQFNLDSRWVKSTLGYLYYHSKGDEGSFPGVSPTVVFAGLTSPAFVNFTAPTLKGLPYAPTHDLIRTISRAVYTQDEIHVTSKLDVVGGVRYTKDMRDGIDGSPTPRGAPSVVNYSKGTWTYLVGVDYKVNDQVFAYAHYSTGYISGGQLANISFQPGTAKSWEAGLKADMFDRTLRTNLAVFTVKYGNVQELTGTRVLHVGCYDVPGVSHTAPQCIVNGGDERVTGVELETTYVPPFMEGLTLSGNLSYNDVHFTRVVDTLRGSDGTFVPQYLPAWTGDIAVQYRGPEIIGTAHPLVRLETNYMSSAYAGLNAVLPQLLESMVAARWLLNGRFGLAGFKIGGADAEIAVYGKNLTNNGGETYSADLQFAIQAQYQHARTFGVELNASF